MSNSKRMSIPEGMADLVGAMVNAYKGKIEPHTHDHIIAPMDTTFSETLFDYDFAASVGKDGAGRRYLEDKKQAILDEITLKDASGSEVDAIEARAERVQDMINFIYGKHQ